MFSLVARRFALALSRPSALLNKLTTSIVRFTAPASGNALAVEKFHKNVNKPLDADFQPVVAPMRVLQPLKSLGGMSLLSYMAIEATEGHFQMYKMWRVDLAKDLRVALDRVDELEMLVRDLTTFVEMQKDEIALLRNS